MKESGPSYVNAEAVERVLTRFSGANAAAIIAHLRGEVLGA